MHLEDMRTFRFIIPLHENYKLIIKIDFKEKKFRKKMMNKLIPVIKKEVNLLSTRRILERINSSFLLFCTKC